MPFDISTLPVVPKELRPRRVYVAEEVSSDVKDGVEARGWSIVDVRVLPSSNMVERREAVLAYLEGARCGSLELAPRQIAALELEAKACGILGTKGLDEKPKEEVPEEELLALLPKVSTRIRTGLDVKKGVKKTNG
jgi:hypothetical protein